MRLAIFLIVSLFATSLMAEPCHYVVSVDNLKKYEQDGQTFYVFNEKVIDKSKNDGCFYPVQTAETIKQLVQDAEDFQKLSKAYKDLTDRVEALNQKYESLIKAHEATLDRSIDLTTKYQQQVEEYKKLASDYDELVVKFDTLAGDYREVALSTSSTISFDVGAGATSDLGGVGMLGLGIKLGFLCQQIKLWGIYQKDNSGALVGCSFGF